jgi:hypothetical protein
MKLGCFPAALNPQFGMVANQVADTLLSMLEHEMDLFLGQVKFLFQVSNHENTMIHLMGRILSIGCFQSSSSASQNSQQVPKKEMRQSH